MKRRYLVLLTLAAVASVLAAIVGAFYGIEDWRGAHAWEQARRELAAQGESLDPADFIPPPVPDERNLAMIPLFARTLDYSVDPKTNLLTFGPHRSDDNLFRDMPYGHDGKRPKGVAAFGGWESAHPIPLERVQEYYAQRTDFPHPVKPGTASADVLLALTKFAPVLDVIDAAIPVRPDSRFPVNWLHWPPSTLALPHDNLIQEMTGVLRLRASAHLDAGRPAEAAHDLATAFRLGAAIRPEPTLIAHLIIITCDGMLLQPIWEGLAARHWNEAELHEIQAALRADDLLADYAHAVRAERALFFCRMFDGVRKSGTTRGLGDFVLSDLNDPNDPTRKAFRRITAWFPSGWTDENERNVCLAYQEYITGMVNVKARRVAVERLKARQRQIDEEGTRFEPAAFVVKLIEPVLKSILERTTRTQTACDEAETACALERYFLVHQTYPESLHVLVPAFLDRVPTDLIDGASMRYRRTEDGRYLLYGIGWDEHDDGGTLTWQRNSNASEYSKPDNKKGDWIWQYKPVSPSTP